MRASCDLGEPNKKQEYERQVEKHKRLNATRNAKEVPFLPVPGVDLMGHQQRDRQNVGTNKLHHDDDRCSDRRTPCLRVCNGLFDSRTTNLCNFSGEADPVSRQRRDSRYIL